MDKLRSLNLLRWWAVAWFVLGFGAALASPLIQPRTMELVCSNASGATLVVHHAGSNAVLDTVGMLVLPGVVAVPHADSAFDDAGRLVDAASDQRLRAHCRQLVGVAGRLTG